MTNPLYSFDGGKGLGSPLATFSDSVTGSGWSHQSGNYAVDFQDDVVNGTLKSHSNNDFYSSMPDLESQTRPPSLPALPQVNIGVDSPFQKSSFGTSSGSGIRNSSLRSQRSKEGLRASNDALKRTNSTSLSPTVKFSVRNSEQSADNYEYDGLLGLAGPSSDDGYRSENEQLPSLLTGSAVQSGMRPGSVSALSTPGGSAKNVMVQGHRSGRGAGCLTPLPSAPTASTSSTSLGTVSRNNTSADMSRRGSTHLTPQPPSFSKTKSDGVSDTTRTRSPLYGETWPLLGGGAPPSDARRSKQDGSIRESALLNGANRKSAAAVTSNRAATFVGVRDPPDDLHTSSTTAHGRSSPRGNTTNPPRVDGSPSPRASSSMRGGSSVTTRTQSDGDLRMRSSSRSSEQEGSTGGGGLPASSPGRRSRSASEPSPIADEENAYFPFGLMEMPPVPSPERVRGGGAGGGGGVVETSTTTTSRTHPFGEPQPTQPQQSASKPSKRSAANGVKSLAALNPSSKEQRPYDLSFATDANTGYEGDDSKVNTIDFSTLTLVPPTLRPSPLPSSGGKQSRQQSSDGDFLRDGGYDDIVDDVAAQTTKIAKAAPLPSPTKSTPTRAGQPSVPALGRFQPLPNTAHSGNAVETGQSSCADAPPAPPRLQKKLSTFEPVPMMTSAMSASGRHFTFDGAKAASPVSSSSSNRTSLSNIKSGVVPSPATQESKLEASMSLSRSASTRAPRPPSRNPVDRAAVVGDVVVVTAETLPTTVSPHLLRGCKKNSPTANDTSTAIISAPPTGAAEKTAPSKGHSSGGGGSGTLPSIVPATRRQSTRPPTTTGAARSSTPHSRLIKAIGPAGGASRSNVKTAVTDTSLSPITSDDDSVDSVGTTEQNALINRTLRQVHSSVRIRMKVDEAALLPTSNEPWPLQPPPRGIMIKLRVFDPLHPRSRGARMRELPDGKRQANWVPPETHYTTTLADLAAYEDEEDTEEEKTTATAMTAAHVDEAARLRVVQDFEDDIWDNEEVDVDSAPSTVKLSPKPTGAAAAVLAMQPSSPLPPAFAALRSWTASAVSSSENAAKRPAEVSAGSLRHSADRGLNSASSSKQNSTHKLGSPGLVGFSPVPATAIVPSSAESSSSPYPDGPHLLMDGSLNISFNPSKRYGGIVVDEVEKVRRMREDSIFTPVMDDLSVEPSRQSSLTSRDQPDSVQKRDTQVEPFRATPSGASTSLHVGKSPVLVGRGFNLRPASPQPGEVGAVNSSSSYNNSMSNNSNAAPRLTVGQAALSGSHRQSLQSVRNDSLLLDANGHPVIPQSPTVPTFARIIAQRSGGVGGRVASGSQDSLSSDYGVMGGGLGSFGNRKSIVTFAEGEPENNSAHHC
jgi:hypothetical protein